MKSRTKLGQFSEGFLPTFFCVSANAVGKRQQNDTLRIKLLCQCRDIWTVMQSWRKKLFIFCLSFNAAYVVLPLVCLLHVTIFSVLCRASDIAFMSIYC